MRRNDTDGQSHTACKSQEAVALRLSLRGRKQMAGTDVDERACGCR
jgi:hypothetical protein